MILFCFITDETNPSLVTQRSLRKENWVELLKGTRFVLTCCVTWSVETVCLCCDWGVCLFLAECLQGYQCLKALVWSTGRIPLIPTADQYSKAFWIKTFSFHSLPLPDYQFETHIIWATIYIILLTMMKCAKYDEVSPPYLGADYQHTRSCAL